jgi:hypothetical protein
MITNKKTTLNTGMNSMPNQFLSNKSNIPSSNIMNFSNSGIQKSYSSIVGGRNQYNSMPNYKVGGGAGGAIDKLAMMMGGTIPNPYQFSKMVSSGKSDVELEQEAKRLGYFSTRQMQSDIRRKRLEREIREQQEDQLYPSEV